MCILCILHNLSSYINGREFIEREGGLKKKNEVENERGTEGE